MSRFTVVRAVAALAVGVALLGCANSNTATSPVAAPPAAKADPPSPATTTPGDRIDTAEAAAVRAFQERIKEYVAFHSRVEATVPKLTETSNPEKIAEREKALGEALIKARPNPKEGDFFIKEYMPYLQKAIKEDFAKRSMVDRKALIKELPAKGFKIDVNMIYPSTIPLETFPANLIKMLPELPPDFEYRIVYRHLILRDVKGNVIMDIARDVFPIPL